ncbi:MAG TPA: rhodanese-like domain-containing protein [Pyrinomonadaceae bacterium]|jgi:UPF0176 protein
MSAFQIICFYRFCTMPDGLVELRGQLRSLMRGLNVKGTIILAEEGFNAAICGPQGRIAKFLTEAEQLFGTSIDYRSSLHERMPFRRVDVKIKPEIVTLKRDVVVTESNGTHVEPADWNRLISDPETFVLDARNDYEFRTGTFRGAVNPKTTKFSELPDWVAENLDPERHKRVAMFCTGGIRCEKLAPYLQQLGFEEVHQLKGGILRYLESTSQDESLWEGECFVFDDRVTLDNSLSKGTEPDHSQRP